MSPSFDSSPNNDPWQTPPLPEIGANELATFLQLLGEQDSSRALDLSFVGEFLRGASQTDLPVKALFSAWRIYQQAALTPEGLSDLLVIATKSQELTGDSAFLMALDTLQSEYPELLTSHDNAQSSPEFLRLMASWIESVSHRADLYPVDFILHTRSPRRHEHLAAMRAVADVSQATGGEPGQYLAFQAARLCMCSPKSEPTRMIDALLSIRADIGGAPSEELFAAVRACPPSSAESILIGISKISQRQGGDHIAQFVTKLLKDLPAIANPPNIASQCVALLKAFPENTPDYYRAVAVLTTYAERGWGVSALARELKEGLTNHRASATHNILAALRNADQHETPPAHYGIDNLRRLTDEEADTYLRCFANQPSEVIAKGIQVAFQQLPGLLDVPDHLMRRIYDALDRENFTSGSAVVDFARLILVRHAVLETVGRGAGSSLSGAKLESLYGGATKNDTIPYGPNEPEAVQMQKEIRRGFRRMIDQSYGFSTFTCDTRTFPDGDDWSLVSSARGLGAEVFAIQAQSSRNFPGRGVYIKGIDPGLVYPDKQSPGEERYATFKRVVKGLGAEAEVDLLEQAGFLFTRGMLAVHLNDRYTTLNGIPYTYVVFNEHFGNPQLDLAFFIPSKVMINLIGPSLIRWSEYDSDTAARARDLNSVIQSPRDLWKASLDAGLEPLDIGSGGNLGGSFSNAHRPCSHPFHIWEHDRIGETKDIYGHVHKSHLKGGYDYSRRLITESDLVPFRVAHQQNYALLNRFCNLVDLALISIAHHDMGVTRQIEDSFSDAPIDPDLPPINPRTCWRLEQAYRWHHQLKAEQESDTAYPVMALVPTLDMGGRVKPLVTLDTLTLRLSFHAGTPYAGKSVQLPLASNGRGVEEEAIWIEMVSPLFRSDLAVRPYDRRHRGIL